jgi:DNA (cytosine-5)-methyltransferase 1
MTPLQTDKHLSDTTKSQHMPLHQKIDESSPIVRVGDLCSGMGGLSLAARQLSMRIVFGVDTNATAVRTFEKNFPEAEAIEGSIRSSRIIDRCRKLLKPPNGGPSILVSGPPCQGFSVAGSRNPSDPRNQIIMAVARDVVTLAPDCALVENVSAVLAEEHAQRLKKFYDLFADGQYFVTSVVLDASEFGVAQKRKRAFFFILRKQVTAHELLKRLELHKQPAINVESALRGLPSPLVRPDDYSDERDYGLVHNHFAMQHSQRVIDKIAALPPGTGPMSYRRLCATRPSNTLFSGHRAPPAHFSDPRSITAREAARLQGFPDDFRIYGSFGNQMEQVTNAVPLPLARAVLQVLADLSGVLEP